MEGAALGVGGLVYGDSRNHAALTYLTNFTPKLEAALALIPRNGAPPSPFRTGEAILEEGGVYSLRAGVLDNEETGAVVSALVALDERGSTIMWPIGAGS